MSAKDNNNDDVDMIRGLLDKLRESIDAEKISTSADLLGVESETDKTEKQDAASAHDDDECISEESASENSQNVRENIESLSDEELNTSFGKAEEPEEDGEKLYIDDFDDVFADDAIDKAAGNLDDNDTSISLPGSVDEGVILEDAAQSDDAEEERSSDVADDDVTHKRSHKYHVKYVSEKSESALHQPSADSMEASVSIDAATEDSDADSERSEDDVAPWETDASDIQQIEDVPENNAENDTYGAAGFAASGDTDVSDMTEESYDISDMEEVDELPEGFVFDDPTASCSDSLENDERQHEEDPPENPHFDASNTEEASSYIYDDMITRPEKIPDTDSFTRVMSNGNVSHMENVKLGVGYKKSCAEKEGVALFVDTSSFDDSDCNDSDIINEDADDAVLGTGNDPEENSSADDETAGYKIASTRSLKRKISNTSSVKEYTARDQIDGVFARLKSKMISSRIRLIIVSFLCTVLFVTENVGIFGIDLPWMFSLEYYPRIGVLIDLQILILAGALVYRQLYDGVRGIIGKKPSAHSFLIPVLMLIVIYDAVIFAYNIPSPKLYGFVGCAYIVISLFCEAASFKSDFTSFKVISASGDKLAACIMDNGSVRGEQEQFSSSDNNFKDYKILRIKKVGFVDGFMKRQETKCEDHRLHAYLLIIISAFSTILGVAVGIVRGDVVWGFAAALICASAMTPASAFLAHLYPVYKAVKRASTTDTAIIGEASAKEYAAVNALSFEDVEMFPSSNVKVRRIKLYGDNRLDNVLYYISSLFATVGGPLSGVFGIATSEMGISSDVQFCDAAEDGLVVTVDGRIVSVGKGSFMQRAGVTLAYDSEDEKQSADRNISIMFAAVDGVVCAKFYVRYTIDHDFEENVIQLNESGIKTVIRSYDPNLDNSFLSRICYSPDSCVKVVKKTKSQLLDFAQPRIDSGIVTRNSSGDILRAVLMCKKLMAVIRRNAVLKGVCAGVGAAIAACICFMPFAANIYSAMIVAYILLAMLPSAIFPKFKM